MSKDIWNNKGRLWYSEELINKVIDKCKKTKEACKDDYVKNLLAEDILKILDYKDR